MKPRSSAAVATAIVSVKQWNTPVMPLPSSRSTASVSSDALRVWITSGLPVMRLARI